MWPHHTYGVNGLNQLESTLHEDTSTQVSADWFLRRFLKVSLYIPTQKYDPQFWAQPDPGNHYFHIFESKLSEDAST